jgi:hypothetical protein
MISASTLRAFEQIAKAAPAIKAAQAAHRTFRVLQSLGLIRSDGSSLPLSEVETTSSPPLGYRPATRAEIHNYELALETARARDEQI